jgi:ferritin-like metal-binding protein YciE
MPQTDLSPRIAELLLQSLEHEKGGTQVYTTALKCVQNEELREEWEKYLEQTERHVEVLSAVCGSLRLDIDQDTPGRQVVRHMGQSLVQAMEMARKAGDAAAAELVACECVVLAETKDHLDWQLIGQCAEKALKGQAAQLLKDAYDEVEDQEDEHVYHSKGWCRELWLQSLGMPAVLPPPEEERHVKTAMGQARAEQTRR